MEEELTDIANTSHLELRDASAPIRRPKAMSPRSKNP